MFLAGDIGGTKTQLGVFSTEKVVRFPLYEEEFPNAKYQNFESILSEFLNRIDWPLKSAVLGVAGPVAGGMAKITNLPWVIDEENLCRMYNFSSVRLINDIGAIAFAIPFLDSHDLRVLNQAAPNPGGNIAIIAPGTGLGEAFMTKEGAEYKVHPSEGGHADFAPCNETEVELWRYLRKYYTHVSYERVCSGQGIINISKFLHEKQVKCDTINCSLTQEVFTSTEDIAPIIVNSALDREKRCDVCVNTISLFVSILGAEAGNLALKVLATGGVYIAGGIPRRILPFLEDGTFMTSFKQKGRMSNLISQIPVYVIVHSKVALMGAACYGNKLALEREK